MPEIVVVGAGAIGRGFLPWVFRNSRYEYVFVDSNPKIIEEMRRRRSYSTYRVRHKALEEQVVQVKEAMFPHEFRASTHPDVAAAFVNVGPRSCAAAARILEGLECPVILCENDPATVEAVKGATRLRDVFFAIPDVITSNTAPEHLLRRDPLSIVTEDGVLILDSRARGLEGEFNACDPDELLKKHWTAKLYLHNTPHCIAAYLGALVGARYIHEAMRINQVNGIVSGAMTEMLNSLKLRWELPHPFLEWYAEKELARFRCELLFDPISRVAREPLRKLELEGRLIGAAQICLSLGFVPNNILLGIASAMLFDDEADTDRHLTFMRRALSPGAFLTHVLSLRKGEALEIVLGERLPHLIRQLEELPHLGAKPPGPEPEGTERLSLSGASPS